MGSSGVHTINATGYIGRHAAKTSLNLSHPTFFPTREPMVFTNSEKDQLLESLESSGTNIVHRSLDEHARIVEAVKKVDVVIYSAGSLQIETQDYIFKAFKEIGKVRGFFPSELGNNVDNDKEGEPAKNTFISGNCSAGYFFPGLAQVGLSGTPRDTTIFPGDGNAKGLDRMGFPIGTSPEINRGRLHEVDLLPRAVNRYKISRSGLDLSDQVNKQRNRQVPSALELWYAKGQPNGDAQIFNHRLHCTFRNPTSVEVMGPVQALFTDLTPQISEGAIWHEDNTKQRRTAPIVSVAATSPDPCFQISIKPPSGKSTLIWVQASDSVSNLKKNIANHIGLPKGYQHLLSEGRSLQDHRAIGFYNIKPGSNIIVNMRLWGGAAASGPRKQSEGGNGSKAKHSPDPHQQHKNEGTSYKHILQGGKSSSTTPQQVGTEPSPYIVEQLNYTPELTIDTTKAEEVRNIYERQALICRFNGFWPKPNDLFHWIFTKWSLNCDVMLCSKGFFIVKIPSEDVRDAVIQ